MAGSNQEKVKEINVMMKEILLRHMEKPGVRPSAISGLTLVRREEVNSSERCFEKPLASVIVQGGKHSTIGAQEYHIHETQCLVSGVDMPSTSYVIDPTPENPFLSLFFYLDRQILSDLVMEMEPEARPSFMEGQGVSVADAEPEFLEAMLRLAELLDKPKQIAIRASYRSAGRGSARALYARLAEQSGYSGHCAYEAEYRYPSAHGRSGTAGQHVGIKPAPAF